MTTQYDAALNVYCMALSDRERSDVICVVGLTRNGAVFTHLAKGPGWTLFQRAVLVRNIITAAWMAFREASRVSR